MPDSTSYSFTYEQTPGAASGVVTGRITSVTLPTGGTFTYTYTGGSTGHITCADGSASGLQRYTPDTGSTSFWNYARTAGAGAAYTTTVTDPSTAANQTVIQFQGIYETERQVFQGSSTSGTLLATTYTCYNGSVSPCNSTAITLPFTQRSITTKLPGANNLTDQHIFKYNSSVFPIEQDDYDYGVGAAGALLRKKAITYAPLGNNIIASKQQITVTNGSGATVSQTSYNYDETAVVATSGTPQHTSVTGSRGNLTSINYYTQGSTYLTRTMTYFDTGSVQTVTDVNGGQTTYAYGACGNSFPTSITEAIGTLTRYMTWNCTGGVALTATDENNQTTTSSYTDTHFWRQASVTDPTSVVTNLTYTSQTQAESVLSFNGGNSASDRLVTLDNEGRPLLAQVRQAPGSTNFDTIETDHDSLGRLSRVTLPFTTTAGTTNSSAPGSATGYDALSRVTSLSDSGGGTLTKAYSQNDVLTTRGPAPTGENTKRRQFERDGLGRLTSVCEITAGTSAWPGGTCAQNTTQTGYWTKYAYDAVGHLTGVTQNAQSSGSTQSRSYSYDLIGRLLTETNPEAGTTSYTYDTDATCGTYKGNLVKRVDALGNVTCFSYDALHRPLAVTYPSGSYSSLTPQKHFVYDGATVNSIAMTFVESRLAEAYTCFSPCATKLTDIGFSYTARGEPSDVYESTPNSGTYYHVKEQYWANRTLEQLSGLSALPTFTFTPDGEGRRYEVSASSGQNPVTNSTFNSAGFPTSITYGSADSDSYSYDPNTNRLTQYQFNVNGHSLTGALTWNANRTLQALNITDALNSAGTQSCSFSHDDLIRIASAGCGSVWSQTFGYDPFSNISYTGSMSFQPTYSISTNRVTEVGNFTPTYDGNGNATSDPANTYSWDSAGKAVSINGVNLTYDAFGRMVEQSRLGSYTQIVYGPHGRKFALMSGSTLQKAFVPLLSGSQAVYNSSGLSYYGHSDHLGSVRLGSSPTQTVAFDLSYSPFGETYASSGSTDPGFTAQRQDTVSGLFDFAAREYNNVGRWPSPDPSGLASVRLRDPQTLNRYAYVRNNPLTLIDLQGLDEQDDCDEDCGSDDGGLDIDTGGGGSLATSPIDDSGNSPVGSDADLPLEMPQILGTNAMPGEIENSTPIGIDGSTYYILGSNAVDFTSSTGPSFQDQQLQGIAPGVVQGAGSIGDGSTVLAFYGLSAVPGGAYALGLIKSVAVALALTQLAEFFNQGDNSEPGPPQDGHPHDAEPNGGYEGPEPAPISGSPPSPPPPLPPDVIP